MRGDEDRLALTHNVDYLVKDAVDLGGQRDLLAVRSEEQPGLGVTFNEACQVEQLVQILGREDNVLVPTSLWLGCSDAHYGFASRSHANRIP